MTDRAVITIHLADEPFVRELVGLLKRSVNRLPPGDALRVSVLELLERQAADAEARVAESERALHAPSPEGFRREPLRDISARLWEIERKLHIAEKRTLAAMASVSFAEHTPAARAYECGKALGDVKVNITDAIEDIHHAQELIRPTLD
ncbi:MAG: hypothetical protein H0U66_03160 [Gemmatimonadaceae bacterium]|nr:hypothetical protein [Gemmatimonadaceae bacterium]